MLKLYKKDTCPYCQKVMKFIKERNINSVEFKDIIENPENKNTLITVGGKNQVPCLFIDDVPMYESSDIIEYLRENVAEDKSTYNDDNTPSACPLF